MDAILNAVSGLSGIVALVIVAVVAGALVIYIKSRYMIADANQALVITGGKKEPRVLVGGSAFVPPNRKGSFFDLGLKTVTSTNEATHTNSMILVVVEWTAQLRADTSLDQQTGQLNESLRNAILGFTNFEGQVTDSLQQTLEGEVRAVIAKMTPEDLVRDKAKFAQDVDTNVRDSMAELGFKLVSLNIGKITDPNGYYNNLAAKDREEKRSEAANLTAEADQSIAVRRAQADKASKAAEQERDIAVANLRRETALRNSEIQAETDAAQADADVAGELRRETRNEELAAQRGKVRVIEVQQQKAAAEAQRDVELTEAETEKQRQVVEAEAAKEQARIAAEAEARQAEIAAEAAANVAKQQASGEKEAAVTRAEGEAEAINKTTEARAKQVKETGLAEAAVARAKGEAEADAIRAKGSAEAEAQRLMAEALAANDGANLKVTLAEVESRTRIEVATALGAAMHEVGTKATIIDMGGSGSNGQGGLLGSVLSGIPQLLKQLDVQSGALHDMPFGELLGSVIASASNGSSSDGTQVTIEATTDNEGSEPAHVPVSVGTSESNGQEPSSDTVDEQTQV